MLNTDAPIDTTDAISAFCDEGLALQFSERHARDLRYVAAWGKWFKWTGKEWKRDDTLLTLELARDLCRYVARLTPDRGKSVASNRTVGAVLHLARADRRHASTPELWDRNPWLLNTPAGMPLPSAHRRYAVHAREDYITKCTAVGPEGDCPMWLRFLARVYR